jgi:hypothetical protein
MTIAARSLVLLLAALAAPAVKTNASDLTAPLPRLFMLDAKALAEAKKRVESGDNFLNLAVGRLKRDADRALGLENLSVTQKSLLPPSGDKRDYMSIAPYWWPNPHTPDGLPYVRRDGEINPDRDRVSDRKRLEALVQNVKTLAVAYFYTDKDRYAGHAVKLLRAWFIDQNTGMKPHLKYAQAVPGRNAGRAAGIIETHNFPELLDAVALLQPSNAWTQADRKRLRDWFGSYLSWLAESPEGKLEARAENNHGTWYDVQVASCALFVERDEIAKNILSEFASRRIAKQVASDGRQPRELARARGWHYSIFNLEALFNAASIADKIGIDLWNYETADRRGLRLALDWLAPFALGKAKWPYKEISGFQPERLAPLLRRAAIRYREPAYEEALAKLRKVTGEERWQLLYPKIPPLK